MNDLLQRLQSPAQRWFLAPLLFAVAVGSASGEVRSPQELKALPLEELLDTKVISGTRTLESWRTIPAAISVVPHETIRRSGAVWLVDALRLAPGLNVSRSVGSSYAISARGFNSSSSNKLEVIFDGRSLYTPMTSGVFWEVQDAMLEDIARIEVVRGPGGALWGSNAINGVINIVSKSAEETQGALIVAGGGSEERLVAGVRYGGKLGSSTYYRTYFKHITRHDQAMVNGTDAGDGMVQNQGGFRLDSVWRGENKITFQGDVYGNTFGVRTRPDAVNSGGNVLGRWTRPLGADSELQVQAYFDHGRRDVPLQLREERKTYDLDVQHRFKAGERHELVLGGDYQRSIDDTGVTGKTFIFSPRSRALDRFSFFGQDEFALVPKRVNLTFGVRVEHNDYTGWENQPSVRLKVTPDERQMFWASASHAVRAPTRIDTESRFIPNPNNGVVRIRGTLDFRSEEVTTYELGYRVHPNHRLFLDLAGYYSDYSNLKTSEPNPLPPGLPLLIRNEREAEIYGGELSMTFQATDIWRLSANYHYLHEEFRLKPGSRDTTAAALDANDPSHIATLQSSLTLRRNIDFDWTLHYVSRPPNPTFPAYFNLNARLAYRPRENWEISIVGQNLLDKRHPEFGGGATQTQVQRGFYGQLTYRFP
jgi:iron complex outermembrane receptor protein